MATACVPVRRYKRAHFCAAPFPEANSHVLHHRCRHRRPGRVPRVRLPQSNFWALTLGCIGVVYGDIGTSPLYALRESVSAAVGPAMPANETVVLGILSLIIWALLIVVTAKYVADPVARRQ